MERGVDAMIVFSIGAVEVHADAPGSREIRSDAGVSVAPRVHRLATPGYVKTSWSRGGSFLAALRKTYDLLGFGLCRLHHL